MPRNSSATAREAKSTRRTKPSANSNSRKPHVIDASLKRRARLLLTNSSIPGQTRSLIRYALEIKDKRLEQLVRQVEQDEKTLDHVYID